jgi:hypothetical protein
MSIYIVITKNTCIKSLTVTEKDARKSDLFAVPFTVSVRIRSLRRSVLKLIAKPSHTQTSSR